MVCKKCGREIPEGVTYCGHCGAKAGSGKGKPAVWIAGLLALAVLTGTIIGLTGGNGDAEPVVMAPTEQPQPTGTEPEQTQPLLPEELEVCQTPAIEFSWEDYGGTVDQSEETTEPSWQERLPNVPEVWKDHVLLQERDLASCEILRGDVLVTVFFAYEKQSGWTEEELQQTREALEAEGELLERMAAEYGTELNLIWNYQSLPYEETYSCDDWFGWVKPALEANELPNWGRINRTLEAEFGVEAAPVVFCFNLDGRAFACGNDEVDAGETLVLYRDLGAFCHELCHLFGAVDYYYPEQVMAPAEQYFPDSLMLAGGTQVDSLTAYLVGWTDALSAEAMALLEQTAAITWEEYQAAMLAQSETGRVTRVYSFGVYEGDLLFGVMHGQGKLTWSSGTVYEGQWDNGNMHGQGVMTWTNGCRYEGSWVNGRRCGQGTLFWANGAVYEGQWENDRRNGQGTLTYANGYVESGTWKNDEFMG